MDPVTEATAEKLEKSYRSAAVDSISSWSSSRSPGFKPGIHGDTSGLKNQYGGNRITQQSLGPSLKSYPPDCPPLCPRWFHAIDVPKRKPKLLSNKPQLESKSAPVPKKFDAFSEHDSRSIEIAYQQLVEEYYDSKRQQSNLNANSQSSVIGREKSNTNLNDAGSDDNSGGRFRIPVQEDFLFDVDVEKREISPVYWLGPIYEVRRGSWFYQEGTSLRPCEENLAVQLEEGYLKTKPFRNQKVSEISSNLTKSSLKSGESQNSTASTMSNRKRLSSSETISNLSEEPKVAMNESDENCVPSSKEPSTITNNQLQTYRLFGTYMNTVVTYQDANIAWLSADSIMSRVSSTVYQKFAGGGHLGGVKLVRGYIEPNKTKESPDNKSSSSTVPNSPKITEHLLAQHDRTQQKILKSRYGPPKSPEIGKQISQDLMQASHALLISNKTLESNDIEPQGSQEQNDNLSEYNDIDSESQGRQIDHLILCTHGIGQRLGMRTETVNFVHDINVLRKTLKSVYESSPDLQALNSEIDKLPKNCRVQVLPICWRHLLDFPQKGVRQTRKEHDLGDAFGDEEEYPSLEDITIDSVPFVRSLITDLALDILLFQSAYREHICNIVLAESNRIYSLFRERNPDFRGKVSLLGHSLGSAILFDLLSRQKECAKDQGSRPKHHGKRPHSLPKSQPKDLEFEFDVEDFYCYGSPIGLFQMLKGRNILARKSRKEISPGEPAIDSENLQDSFFSSSSSSQLPSNQKMSSDRELPPTVSSPKVGRLFNIFHPSDPIAYRLEPLISPVMSSVKPQNLPFTKRSISSSMSGIGAKVGQSVSGILTSLSSGLASSIFNRSLGLTTGDIARMEASGPSKQSAQAIGMSKTSSATLDGSALKKEEGSSKKRRPDDSSTTTDQEGIGSGSSTNFFDENIETLYSGFQKSYRVDQSTAEEKLRRIKREEAKVRALNSNGRVDYSLQETFLDYNPMNTIASHMSYWADEDVSHFMMSQLLSGNRETAKHEKITTEKDL
ncbi:putative phospholipase, mitochondrial [Erysiphe necator]|nr:putative phospholipase, mitochondrial [Erysiphe necator]